MSTPLVSLDLEVRDPRPHVVIVGGGFGGLETAKALRRAPVRITLIDAHNHHLFQPLLYQVAMAGLSPAEIAIPIRSVLRHQKNVRVLLGRVRAVDLGARRLELFEGYLIHYDHLVLAVGAITNWFGHDHWAAHALGLKSVEDAVQIRRRVLLAFERAEREPNPEIRRRLLTFVVIGGGPTGVELAGALSELSRRVLARDFRLINPGDARVVLVEAGPRILSTFDEALSAAAAGQLAQIGVEVRVRSAVKEIDAKGVHLEAELIEADTIIWGAGVRAHPLTKTLGVELDRGGRVIVANDCTVPGHPTACVIGDVAHFEQNGAPLPGVSAVAMQQGRWVARNIAREVEGKAREPFTYFDKGSMATVGRSRAVVELGRVRFSGFLAWLTWLFVHIWYLVGFKNRVFVFLQWIFAYVVYRRGARLITAPYAPPPDPEAGA